jgi:hypothetical protein
MRDAGWPQGGGLRVPILHGVEVRNVTRYKLKGPLLTRVLVLGVGGTFFGVAMAGLAIGSWQRFLSGESAWSAAELAGFTVASFLPWTAVLCGCASCIAVTAGNDGLKIRTCYFLDFFVPWGEVIDIRAGATYSLRVRGRVNKALVTVRGGLTCIHRGIPRRTSQGWEWPRGFIVISEAEGYDELVQVIRDHVRARVD